MALHVRGMFDLRQELIGNGVLGLQGGLYQFTQDYSFSSRRRIAGPQRQWAH
jgi:hypothetical protein